MRRDFHTNASEITTKIQNQLIHKNIIKRINYKNKTDIYTLQLRHAMQLLKIMKLYNVNDPWVTTRKEKQGITTPTLRRPQEIDMGILSLILPPGDGIQ